MIYYKIIEIKSNHYTQLNNKKIKDEEIEINGEIYNINPSETDKKNTIYVNDNLNIYNSNYNVWSEYIFLYDNFLKRKKMIECIAKKYKYKIYSYEICKMIVIYYDNINDLNLLKENEILFNLQNNIHYYIGDEEILQKKLNEIKENKNKLYNYLKNKKKIIVSYDYLLKIIRLNGFKALCYFHYYS